MDSRKIADLVIEGALEKKGLDLLLMDMRGITLICDYFVLITGNSRTHTRAISEHIAQKLKEEFGFLNDKVQGMEDGSWILMDYGSVIVHVFLENLRRYYDLEGLWKDARFEWFDEEGNVISKDNGEKIVI